MNVTRGVFVIADIEDVFALTFAGVIASVHESIIRLQRQIHSFVIAILV